MSFDGGKQYLAKIKIAKMILMKRYVCPRCGAKFDGRLDRCPRCAQRIVYQKDDKYFDALGNELILRRNHIVRIIPNEKGPR